MNIAEIKAKVAPVEGWFSDAQMDFLYPSVSSMHEGMNLVEIGSYHGRSTMFFRLANEKIKITTIDPCKPYEASGRILTPPDGIDKEIMDLGNITQIKKASLDAVGDIDFSIDYLFIDGDHKFEAVYADIKAWIPKVHGLVVFHDYHFTHAGVPDAVEKAVNEGMFEPLSYRDAVLIGRHRRIL